MGEKEEGSQVRPESVLVVAFNGKTRVSLLISFSVGCTMCQLLVASGVKNTWRWTMGQFRLCVAGILLVGVYACSDGKPSSSPPSSTPDSSVLGERLSALDFKVTRLQTELFIQKYSGTQEVVWFDPQDDKGYQAVKGPAGPLLVVLEKVEPYVDGFTVHMRIGNPTSAGFSGIKGSVKWGRKFDEKKDDAFNELAEKQIELKDFLPAGSWTIVNFNIGPAAPDQVRRIGFAPQFDSIQLRGPIR